VSRQCERREWDLTVAFGSPVVLSSLFLEDDYFSIQSLNHKNKFLVKLQCNTKVYHLKFADRKQ
jgi:hypothetical protein